MTTSSIILILASFSISFLFGWYHHKMVTYWYRRGWREGMMAGLRKGSAIAIESDDTGEKQ